MGHSAERGNRGKRKEACRLLGGSEEYRGRSQHQAEHAVIRKAVFIFEPGQDQDSGVDRLQEAIPDRDRRKKIDSKLSVQMGDRLLLQLALKQILLAQLQGPSLPTQKQVIDNKEALLDLKERLGKINAYYAKE